jgi:hypothetical protein
VRPEMLVAAIGAAVLTCVAPSGADAQPGQHHERTLADNWNTAACGLTGRAELDLATPARLTRLDLWYHWNPGESSVAYSIDANGRAVGAGTLRRAECDAYQKSWCVARDTPNLQLSAGRFQIRAARAGVCQNAGSGGSGFIRAYGVTVSGAVVPNNPITSNSTSSKPPPPECDCKPGDEMCLVLCHHNPGQPPSR